MTQGLIKIFVLTMTAMTLTSAELALAKGASCKAVDLRSQLGPARSQSGTGWCHSFTAADLLSAKLAYPVSAADIARNYYPNKGLFMTVIDAFGGGTEAQFSGTSFSALNSAIKNGVCAEKNFPFDLVKKNLGTHVEAMSKSVCNQYRMGLRGHFEVDSRTVGFGDGQAEPIIQEQLLKSNIVAIDFNSYRLRNAGGKKEFPLGLAGHASSIVGMRPAANGGCEYLVRGTWGPTCGSYDETLECEEGNVWVPGFDLSYMVFSVNWLERLQ